MLKSSVFTFRAKLDQSPKSVKYKAMKRRMERD